MFSGAIPDRLKRSTFDSVREAPISSRSLHSASSKNTSAAHNRACRSGMHGVAPGVSSGATKCVRKPSRSDSCGRAATTRKGPISWGPAGSSRRANLQRASACLDDQHRFVDARFELDDPSVTKMFEEHGWAWNDNPFVGSRELQGLKILVM